MAEAQTNNHEIKNLSGLENELQSTQTNLDWGKIKDDLKKIYGIDIDKEVFNITKEELTKLQQELSISNDKAKTLYENLYKERLETKIQTNGIKEVNLDNAMSGLENNERLKGLKEIFSKGLDSLLDKPEYQFLGDRKEMFKLVIATDLMNGEFFNQIQNINGGFTSFIQKIQPLNEEDLKRNKDPENLKITGNNAKETFDKTIAKHIVNLNTIKDILKTNNINDNKQQQNIVSNIQAFNDPAKLQQLTKEEITSILTEKFINTKKDKTNTGKDEATTEKLTQYMLDSRNKLQDKLQTMKLNGDSVMNTVLELTSREGMMGEATKGVLEMLLKIPFLGKILAMFLGLDKTNPMNDLNEKIGGYKMFKSFMENAGNIDSLKNLDKNSIKQKEVESEFKWLAKVKPSDIPEKDFLKGVFSETGFNIKEKIKDKDGKETGEEKVIYKIKIENLDTNKDNKIDQKELKEAIEKAKKQFEEATKPKTASTEKNK